MGKRIICRCLPLPAETASSSARFESRPYVKVRPVRRPPITLSPALRNLALKLLSVKLMPQLVDPVPYLRLRARRIFSDKVKVGFGPIRTKKTTLGTRAWHVDPIVEWINRNSNTYVCDAFLDHTSLRRYDIIVFVKYTDPLLAAANRQRRRKRQTLLYRATDALLDNDEKTARYRCALSKADALLVSNPMQSAPLPDPKPLIRHISSPIINRKYKSDYSSRDAVTLIWQGYVINLHTMDEFSRLVVGLAAELAVDIKLVYHTNVPSRNEGIVQYVKWKIGEWEEMLVRSDIAVAIKPADDPHQQRKPPTKVLSYMAAGLPVVCTPSESDKAVIAHGETGFLVHSEREWRETLTLLIENADVRERVGRSARAFAAENHSIERIASQYVEVFDELRNVFG